MGSEFVPRYLDMGMGVDIYSPLTSPIITLIVGREERVFAAHEDVLSRSPFFCASLREHFLRVDLPDE